LSTPVDPHWVNFEVDGFMLKFGSQHDMRKGERLIFNFEKEVLKKIKWLSYRGLWEEDMYDEYANLPIIENEEEMKNNSHWGRALRIVKEREYHQPGRRIYPRCSGTGSGSRKGSSTTSMSSFSALDSSLVGQIRC
jgi:hypothetical protein